MFTSGEQAPLTRTYVYIRLLAQMSDI